MSRSPLWQRAVRFQVVGLIGIGVQLGMLALLRGFWQVQLQLATALAVETAIIHNFLWHERWTWSPEGGSAWSRFWRFQLGTGTVTLGNNLVLMTLLVNVLNVHFILANVLSIIAGAVLNFLLADRWVFRRVPRP